MLRDIQLGKRLWRIGDEFASGGFARVHYAEADDGSPAVIKLVPKVTGADRELLFESLSGVPNVVPVLDTGELDDSYALAMPKADKSLRQYLNEIAGPVDIDTAIPILTDIVDALSALATLDVPVVHRDIKPENVLLFQGHWCLCDFGIARYAEATTSPDTRKFMMPPAYAAPEQWATGTGDARHRHLLLWSARV